VLVLMLCSMGTRPSRMSSGGFMVYGERYNIPTQFWDHFLQTNLLNRIS
jgi:hypothetical protein